MSGKKKKNRKEIGDLVAIRYVWFESSESIQLDSYLPESDITSSHNLTSRSESFVSRNVTVLKAKCSLKRQGHKNLLVTV